MQLNSHPAGEVEIRNNGSVPYFQIQLRFAFLDHDGRGLAAKALLISQTLMPGKAIRVPGPALGEIPLSAVTTKITILYADIGPAPSQSR